MLLEKRGFGGLGLNGADTSAGKVLLLALKGGVDLAEAAAVVAVEGAFGPVHGHGVPSALALAVADVGLSFQLYRGAEDGTWPWAVQLDFFSNFFFCRA